MNAEELSRMVDPTKYQVFLLSCHSVFPISFARHPWLVINRKGEVTRWEVHWGLGKSPIGCGHMHVNRYPPFQPIEKFLHRTDLLWKHTRFHGIIEGTEGSLAERMTQFILESPQTYPYCGNYSLRGPNSNTYVQWVLQHFPESKLKLPWNAFGKNYISGRLKVSAK